MKRKNNKGFYLVIFSLIFTMMISIYKPQERIMSSDSITIDTTAKPFTDDPPFI